MDIFLQISQNFKNTAVFEAHRYNDLQGAVLKEHIFSMTKSVHMLS